MSKLKETDTFRHVFGKAKITQRELGVMSVNQVIVLQVLFARETGFCERCGSEENLTADHIVPAVFLNMLGYNVSREFRIEWYQCLCRSCNTKKGCRMEWDNYRTFFILKQVMKEKPTFEYLPQARENAKLVRSFEEKRASVMTPRGRKRLSFDATGKPVWVSSP